MSDVEKKYTATDLEATHTIAFSQGVAYARGEYEANVKALQAQNGILVLTSVGAIAFANRRNIRTMANAAVRTTQNKIRDRKENKRKEKTD